ncbi:MAG: peptidylprolyl isomerase [Treponemataceae bacterium]|nr:peptidylprolyl isomerase [Treponemataceae bacterium]
MKSTEKDLEKADKKKEGKSKKNIWITAGSIIILVLSAITFILVPSIGGFTASQETLVAGKYKGTKIEYGYGTDYLKAVQDYAQYYQQLAQQQGQSLSQFDYYSIFQNAFNAVVLDMMYTEYVNDSGYVPAENAIKRDMIQYFTDENGNYSAKAFREATETYKKTIRDTVTKADISNRFTEDYFGLDTYYIANTLYGLKTSANESRFFTDLTKKARSFEMVAFAKTDYPDDKTTEFAKGNSDLFLKYDFTAVTAADENELKGFKTQIDNNEITFDDAATTLSSKSYCDDNGKVSRTYAYQIKGILTSDEDFTKIAGLSAGEISDITKTATGFALFRCDSAPVSPDFSDRETLDAVKYYISYNEQGLIDDYYTGLAEDFALNATKLGFDEAASAAGVTKKEIPEFSINYGGNGFIGTLPFSDIEELSSAATDENFFKTAFTLKENEISSPISVGNNVIVLKLLKETIKEDTEEDDSDFQYYQYYVRNIASEGFDSEMLSNADVENNVIDLWAQML